MQIASHVARIVAIHILVSPRTIKHIKRPTSFAFSTAVYRCITVIAHPLTGFLYAAVYTLLSPSSSVAHNYNFYRNSQISISIKSDKHNRVLLVLSKWLQFEAASSVCECVQGDNFGELWYTITRFFFANGMFQIILETANKNSASRTSTRGNKNRAQNCTPTFMRAHAKCNEIQTRN